ncbi:DNA (cytosine-5-)-methyltransferase, partial [Vibrio parahaemolyticus]|nr:DNA (cytosine-5-)-methyltransferase [Vibrio parahaemolyticus]
MKKIKYFDFFSGIGGFKSAVDAINDLPAKFEHAGFCEIEKNASKFYSEHYFDGDLKDIEFVNNVEDIKTVINPLGFKLNKFDLLLGGFPCQSFSNVGYRKGLEDERGQLFYNILHLLDEYEPEFFVLENVQKIATLKKGSVLEEMKSALEDCGYHVYLWDLVASDYGVPQKRRRIFFAGVKNYHRKKALNVPPKLDLSKTKYPTAWHLLEKNNVDSKHYIPKRTRQTVLYKNPKWQGDVNIDNALARPITASMAKWHRANQDNYFSDSYINSSDPFVRPDVDLISEPIRRITPLEGFRLQGFDDRFEETRKRLKISYSAAYKLIGNAVPVPLAKAVVHHLLLNYLT